MTETNKNLVIKFIQSKQDSFSTNTDFLGFLADLLIEAKEDQDQAFLDWIATRKTEVMDEFNELSVVWATNYWY